MDSVQKYILDQVKNILMGRGFSVAQKTPASSNTGMLYVYGGRGVITVGVIYYDFQLDTFKMSIEWRKKMIPSQVGRDDYFDFCQGYTDTTLFWNVLILLAAYDPKPVPKSIMELEYGILPKCFSIKERGL